MYSLTAQPSRETIEETFDAVEYDCGMELNARIFKARNDARMTQEELANAVKKTRGAVAQWESGEVRPRHSTLVAIAAATNKPLQWLESGGSSEQGIGLKVIGEVAAGLWREGSVTFTQSIEPVAPHPDYPASAQRLYKVSGNSINRYAKNGEYLHAVNMHEADLKAEEGDLVIVRRMEHGKAEYTAKTLAFDQGQWVLRPESEDAEWQDDIPLEGDDGVEIEVTDIVIAKWSPIPRRRKVTRQSFDPFR